MILMIFNMFDILTPVCLKIFSIFELNFALAIILLIYAIKKIAFRYKGKNTNYDEIMTCIKKSDQDRYFKKLIRIINLNPDIINTCYNNGTTPFLKACSLGMTKVVNEMILKGADLNSSNNEGNAAFYLATYHLVLNQNIRDASLIRTLFYAGCDLNKKNHNGFAPIHLAAYFGHVPLILWLLEKGADSNVDPLPAGIALANGFETAACILIKKPKRTITDK